MFILGSNFCGGINACAFTPTVLDDLDFVELKNGIYDELFITENVTDTISRDIPTSWDNETIMNPKFNDNTHAGNVNWSLDDVSDIIIKSRKVGDFKWKTIATKEVHSFNDLTIYHNDYFIPNGQETEYALVPVLYGVEGEYDLVKITPKFDKMFLIEGDTVYGTAITDGFCDTTRNIPSSNVELLNRRYPIFVRNTIANYDTGSCTGYWLPTNPDDECKLPYDKEHDFIRIDYQKEVMDFICDSKPKILKLPDGRIWIIQVTPNPTSTADKTYQHRQISFSWVEIADINSESDLYYLGLSDVAEEWWDE